MQIIDKDFSELPFDKVDFENGNWTWGRGGYPLGDYDYCITHYDADLITRYPCPKFLNSMLRKEYECGSAEVRAKFRRLLGI